MGCLMGYPTWVVAQPIGRPMGCPTEILCSHGTPHGVSSGGNSFHVSSHDIFRGQHVFLMGCPIDNPMTLSYADMLPMGHPMGHPMVRLMGRPIRYPMGYGAIHGLTHGMSHGGTYGTGGNTHGTSHGMPHG